MKKQILFSVFLFCALVGFNVANALQPPPNDYQSAQALLQHFQANGEPANVQQAMQAVVTLLQPPARLMTVADLTWQYAFTLPVGPGGCQSFSFSNGPIGYNPAKNSLFVGGTVANACQNAPLVAEVTIPGSGNKSTFIQGFADPSGGLNAVVNAQGVRCGGFCPFGGVLLWSSYGNYDANGSIKVSLGQSTMSLAAPQAQGMYSLAATVDGRSVPNGAMAGWVTPVPAGWASTFHGISHFVGLGGVNIISRTSAGPAAFGINASTLSTTAPNLATPYLFYPAWNPNPHYCPGFDVTPNVWNGEVRGMAAISNSAIYGMIFGGCQPVGKEWYGLAVTDPNNPLNPRNPPPGCSGTDPCSIYEGNHSQGKQPSVFIYDPFQVAAAKHPYDPTPVISPLVWPGQGKCDTILGVADDLVGHLYIEHGLKGLPSVEVYSYPTKP